MTSALNRLKECVVFVMCTTMLTAYNFILCYQEAEFVGINYQLVRLSVGNCSFYIYMKRPQ